MKYFIIFSYLISFTFSQGVFATQNFCVNCGHKSSVAESKDFAIQAYEKKCREDFEKNQCARLNSDEDHRKKILSCTADDLDIKVAEPSKACASDVVLGLLWPVAVPFLVKEALDSDKKCFDDVEAKRATFIRYNNTVRPLLEKVSEAERITWGREILIPDELIEASAHYTCSEINNTLFRKRRKHDELLGKLIAKKIMPAAPPEVSPLVSMVTKSVQSFSCYRTEYKVVMACVVLGAGVAGKSISTMAKGRMPLSNIKISPKPKSFTTTFGDYINRYEETPPIPGSPTARIMAESKVTLNETDRLLSDVTLPNAEKLNSMFGLDKSGSSMKFVSRKTDPTTEEYHRSLSRGEVIIQEDTPHDVLDHAGGYVKIADSEIWNKSKKMLADMFQILDSPSTTQSQKKAAQTVIDDVALKLEGYTSELQYSDLQGNRLKELQTKKILTDGIESI